MIGQLRHYAVKLAQEGIAAPGRCALLAWDDVILGHGPDDLCDLGRQLLDRLPLTALAIVEPALPFGELLLRRLPVDSVCIVPRDTETRTFLHDIPLLRAPVDPQQLATLLGRRKGVLVEGVGIVASGALTVEQAYANASSLFHALYVKYLLDVLTEGFVLDGEAARFAAFREQALEEPSAVGLEFHPDPCGDAVTLLAEMERVGRYTVQRHLVDSFFGNISARLGNDLYISQTASALDALAGCIDPVPFDNSTTLGLTASSELPAHRRIFELTDARTILHGHSRFAVALSMLCQRTPDCTIVDCWRDCPKVRLLGGIPVVAGEIGAGGLARRVPPVIGAPGAAIVFGHGVFAIGRRDFAEPFHALVAAERWCRHEYFRRLDARQPYG